MNNLILTANETMMRVMLDGGDFVKEFFTNAGNYVKSLGSYITLLIGVALILATGWQLFKAFASRGSGINWVVIIGGLLVGGVLAFGGWKLISAGRYSGLGKDTMAEVMNGASTEKFDSVNSSYDSAAKAGTALKTIADEFILPFGTALAVCTGAVLVILAIIETAKFFFAGGRAQMSWLKVGAMFVIGVVMFVGTGQEGFDWANKIGITSKNTIINMSNGDANEAGGLNYGNLSEYDPDSDSNMSADPADVS